VTNIVHYMLAFHAPFHFLINPLCSRDFHVNIYRKGNQQNRKCTSELSWMDLLSCTFFKYFFDIMIIFMVMI
jgi:hypothetical protein